MGEKQKQQSGSRGMSETIPEMVREDRIEALTDTIIEAALHEAMCMRVGPTYIVEALSRAIVIAEKISDIVKNPKDGAERMKGLREWVGVFDAASDPERKIA
jgi:hypothetical protein